MQTPEIILTEDQRNELMQIPSTISDWEIAKYYTLSETDLEVINQHRRNHNRLGFAVQLCCLRYPGWPLTYMKSIPDTVLSYISMQINVDHIKEFEAYAQREKTRREHLQELRDLYGYISFSEDIGSQLENRLLPHAMENDNSLRLVKLAIENLRGQKIILPGITTIEKIVGKVSRLAEDKIYEIINKSLTLKQKKALDSLVESSNEMTSATLTHLKEEPGQGSPQTFLKIIERLEAIRNLGLTLDLKEIHPNRIKQLSRLGSKYELYSFRRFEEPKRYAMLAVFLQDLSERLIDYAVEIHDK